MAKGEANRRGKPARTNAKATALGMVNVTIASTDPQVRQVLDHIVQDVQKLGYNSQSTFAIRLATQEALINATRHGNKRNPKKKIHVSAKITRKEAVIEVEDEGSGFDRKHVPDPTLMENLEKSTGRGIHLIEAYMNKVSWTHGGRRVKMVRRNEPDVFPRA